MLEWPHSASFPKVKATPMLRVHLDSLKLSVKLAVFKIVVGVLNQVGCNIFVALLFKAHIHRTLSGWKAGCLLLSSLSSDYEIEPEPRWDSCLLAERPCSLSYGHSKWFWQAYLSQENSAYCHNLEHSVNRFVQTGSLPWWLSKGYIKEV